MKNTYNKIDTITNEIKKRVGHKNIIIQTGYKNMLFILKIRKLKQEIWPAFFITWLSPFLEFGNILFFPNYHYIVINRETGELIAVLNTLPLNLAPHDIPFPETGYNYCIQKAITSYFRRKNTLSAVAVSIDQQYQGKSLSSILVKLIRHVAENHDIRKVIIPIRPPFKAKYDDESMETFLNRKDHKGELIDPWLKIHIREGGILRYVCEKSMTIKARSENGKNGQTNLLNRMAGIQFQGHWII